MDGRLKRQRIFPLAPSIESRKVNQNNLISDIPMTVVERTRRFRECKKLLVRHNSDGLKRPLTAAEKQRRYRERKKLLAEQNSDGNKRLLTAVVRQQNHGEQKRLLAKQNTDGHKRPLSSAEKQRRYREQKKLFPGQNSNGRKRPLTAAEKQRRYRERKKLLAKQKPDVCNVLLTPLEKQKNQGLTPVEKLHKFDRVFEDTDIYGLCEVVYTKPEEDDSIENISSHSNSSMYNLCEDVDYKPEIVDSTKCNSIDPSSVLDLCETVYIIPEIHDSIKNNLTKSMLSTSLIINRTELNNEETTDSNSQSLSGSEGTQTSSVQENEIGEENNALKKKREYQQRYREQNREKLKLREAERRRRQRNSEIISEVIIDDEISTKSLSVGGLEATQTPSLQENEQVEENNALKKKRECQQRYREQNREKLKLREAEIRPHQRKSEIISEAIIDDEISTNSLSAAGLEKTQNLFVEITKRNKRDTNIYDLCDTVNIEPELEDSITHISTDSKNLERTFFFGRKLSDFDSPLEAERYFNLAQKYIIRQDQEIRRLNNRIRELEAQQK